MSIIGGVKSKEDDMAAFDAAWMQRWQSLVNDDSVTKIIGKHLTMDVLLAFGATAYVVSFLNGKSATMFLEQP